MSQWSSSMLVSPVTVSDSSCHKKEGREREIGGRERERERERERGGGGGVSTSKAHYSM